MKKVLFAILSIILCVAALCTASACDKGPELTLYVPDGAPALSVAKIINDGKIGDGSSGTRAVKTVVTTGEDAIAKCGNGEADMAVLPTNAAVKICSSRNDYVLYSVNVYGVLYVIGRTPISDVKELVDGQKGKVLYSIGLGNTPEYVFKKICDDNKIEYVDADENEHLGKLAIRYFSDASEIIPLFLKGEADYALVGEPAATQLVNKLVEQGYSTGEPLDLQKLWRQTTESDREGYPQASLIVKKSVFTSADSAKKVCDMLDASLSANANFLKENVGKVKDLLSSAGSALQVNFNQEIISRCNTAFVDGYSARSDIEKYLSEFVGMDSFLPLSPNIFVQSVLSQT